MPELPEVETIRRGIAPHVAGRRIERAVVRDTRLRWPVPPDLPRRLKGRRIVEAQRRGKYLLLPLDNGDRLILHMGMSGRLLLLERGHPLQKHDHVDLELEGGALLRFHDPRRFGAFLLWPAREATHALLQGMGPEPFAPGFDGAYLFARARGRSAPVKTFIMDGRIVVGVGNIYAAEALFRAGIRPGRAAGRVTRAQYARLAEKIREVLGDAIREGGTTLRDYRGSDGAPGYFEQDLNVYGREHQPCRVCGSPIRRSVIGQRSTYFCVLCQV